ncbi:ankyrin repeat-containing domain protein [Microdochium trichocladiopsis]|uniref:Ankyrin repeat-containing domain protein n=1 Tax=Microdochium trichocladiopsis TaxID=1682393 RepID=A0A9P9BNQ3_9PEZI|nr:ankyrin repeat-containing domain protein [Microdochium trichocladiopsis]KAH7031471.1 ankyrin repeat-containing domain protein [Microdochium trichocladiopsis]
MIRKTTYTPYNMYHFQQDDTGQTALQCAMKGGKFEIVRLFLPLISPIDANTCLHWVSDVESLEAILETGHAQVDCFLEGSTLLFNAAADHDGERMRVLLKLGADPNKRCFGQPSYSKSGPITLDDAYPRGPTPLHAFAGYDRNLHLFDEGDVENAEECFQLLLDHGVDINATTDGDGRFSYPPKNMTALHYAVQRRHDGMWSDYSIKGRTELTIAGLLLRAGANPNSRTLDGETPLFYVNTRWPAIVDLLVEHGADVNARANKGRTPLLSLILRGAQGGLDAGIVQKLIDHGADTNIADEAGNTILHNIFRCFDNFKESNTSLLRTLLSAGADLAAANKKGQTPLFVLNMERPEKALLEFLIQEGLDLNARGANGQTVLFNLVNGSQDRIKVFEVLRSLGADPRVVNNNHETLLHVAIQRQLSLEWVRALLDAGVDPRIKSREGLTLIHYVLENCSVQQQTFDIINLLAGLGLPPDQATATGRTPLHFAALRDRDNPHVYEGGNTWIELVLRNTIFGSPDINTQDLGGRTALHLASSVSEYNVGKLLKAGADPTLLTKNCMSPLHVACTTRQPGSIAVLLAALAERGSLHEFLDLRDNDANSGQTPLHLACQSGCSDSVYLLLRHGADPSARDNRGRTPLHVVAESRWGAEFRVSMKTAGEKASLPGGDEYEAFRPHQPGRCQSSDDAAPEIIAALFEAGADLDAREDINGTVGRTAEDVARETGYANFITAMAHLRQLQAGSVRHDDMETQDAVRVLQQITDSTGIPHKVRMHLREGHQAVVKEFARVGGDLLALSSFGDDTSYHHMIAEGQIQLLKHFREELRTVDEQACARRQKMREEEKEKARATRVGEDATDGTKETPDNVDDHDSGGPSSLLGEACERPKPNLAAIKILVDEVGLDVNAYSHVRGFAYKLKKATPLHILASGQYFWQVEALEYLLDRGGADIHATNSGGLSPLLVAISGEHPCGFWREETVRLLLKHGADVNSADPRSGQAALAMSNHIGVTRALLEHGADLSRAPGALAKASASLDTELVQTLLRAGADANTLTAANDTWICENHEPDEDVAVARPDEPRYIMHDAAIQILSENSYTLREEWDLRKADTVGALLDHGGDATKTYGDGSTVLHRIVEDDGLLRPFSKVLASFDLERKGSEGRTLLTSACMPRKPRHHTCYAATEPPITVHIEAANLLLDVGAQVCATDERGRTPLHWMCTMARPFEDKHKEIFERLIEKVGVSTLEHKDDDGRTPLYHCLRSRQTWAAMRLIEKGAARLAPDRNGDGVLHVLASALVGPKAQAEPARALFERLLSLGASIDARNKRGETPLFVFLAASWKAGDTKTEVISHCDALPVFLHASADLEAVTDEGLTMLHAVAGQEPCENHYGDYRQSQDVGDIFAKLLELGLDPRREDSKLRTALDLAVTRDWRNIVDQFSDEGKRRLEEQRRRRLQN